MNDGGVAGVGLVVASGDGPELFQLGESVLGEVAPAIHLAVEADSGLAVGLGWDHRSCPTTVKLRSEPVDVERFVAEQSAEDDTLDQRLHADAVLALAGPQDEAHQSAERIDQGGDFAGQAAARAADGFAPGPPLGATRLLVGGDNGAVDQGVFEVRLAGQACEDALEDAALHPTAEPLEDAVPATEIARQVAPGCARPPPPQHRLEKQPVVPGRRARIRRLAGQQWRDLLPHRVAHHEPTLFQHRPNPAKAALESQPASRRNPQCQQTLVLRFRTGDQNRCAPEWLTAAWRVG